MATRINEDMKIHRKGPTQQEKFFSIFELHQLRASITVAYTGSMTCQFEYWYGERFMK